VKKKVAKKPVKKVAKKPAAKPARKAKKEPSKTALRRQALDARRELKSIALLDEPKKLPATAFQLLVVQEGKDNKVFGSNTVSAARKYKDLTPEEREVRFGRPLGPLHYVLTGRLSSASTMKPTRTKTQMNKPTRNGSRATR
jgi:hypothetical protein